MPFHRLLWGCEKRPTIRLGDSPRAARGGKIDDDCCGDDRPLFQSPAVVSGRTSLIDTLFRDQGLARNPLLFVALVGTAAAIAIGLRHPDALWLLVVFAPLSIVGLIALFQTRHSLRRNFPVSARIRWLFEW